MKKIDDPVTAVAINGTIVTAVGEGNTILIRSDNKAYIEQIKTATLLRNKVVIIPLTAPVEANFSQPLGILAALMSVNPGRATILEMSPEVEKALQKHVGPSISGRVY